MEDIPPEALKAAFTKATSDANSKVEFTEEEGDKFKKAFDDPEFRKMFAEYMEDLQDPKHRAETEAYISQLEGEEKVPQGKELIRPDIGFCAKTHKVINGKKEEKLFINVVSSDKIAKPTKVQVKDGQNWSLPYSLGPPHMEKDKSGSNAPAFDCCFHPDALSLSKNHVRFRDLLVHSAMEGIEAGYKKQNIEVKLNKEYHVVKGIQYKQGQVPAMMIDSGSKDNWEKKTNEVDKADKGLSGTEAAVVPETGGASMENGGKDKKKSKPAIKKGFLNKDKSPIQSKDKPQPLVQEISSTGSTSSAPLSKEKGLELDKLVDSSLDIKDTPPSAVPQIKEGKTTMKKRPQTIPPVPPAGVDTSGPQPPMYTMVERGNASMGDFESMGRRLVSSSRPAELVYKIDINKAAKASEVLLDVMPRTLKLEYKDVYFIEIELPYPVDHTKAKAKFDKSTKILSVTIPVRPPAASEVRAAQLKEATTEEVQPGDKSGDKEKEKKKEKEEREEMRERDKKAVPAVRKPAQKTVSLTHSERTSSVSNDGSNPYLADDDDEMRKAREESEKLKNEIAAAAAAAKAKAEEDLKNGVVPPKPKPKPAVAAVAKTTEEPKRSPATITIPEGATFVPSDVWAGAVNGYAFKRGDKGQGYYLDRATTPAPQSDSPQAHTEEEGDTTKSSPAAGDGSSKPVPFEFRQTRVAFAVLLQVPDVVAATVIVHFTSGGFDVSFKAASGLTYSSGFTVHGGVLDSLKCRYDVASQNMVVVLTKAKVDEGMWGTATATGRAAATAALTRREYRAPKGEDKLLGTTDIEKSLSEIKFSATSALTELD